MSRAVPDVCPNCAFPGSDHTSFPSQPTEPQNRRDYFAIVPRDHQRKPVLYPKPEYNPEPRGTSIVHRGGVAQRAHESEFPNVNHESIECGESRVSTGGRERTGGVWCASYSTQSMACRAVAPYVYVGRPGVFGKTGFFV